MSLETNQPTEVERGEVTQVNTIQEVNNDISSATFVPKSTEAYSLCSLTEEMSREEKHANKTTYVTFPLNSPDHHFSLCCSTLTISPRWIGRWLVLEPFQLKIT